MSRLLLDFTDYKSTPFIVPASPQEPYPSINECSTNTSSDTNDQSCTIQSMPPVNITCSVFGYYPSITLYFRQTAEILDAVNSAQWNNTDGTRNKAVTVTAVSSHVAYTCVASDIPGLDDQQRESTVVLAAAAAEETTTEHSIPTETMVDNVQNRARKISKLFRNIVYDQNSNFTLWHLPHVCFHCNSLSFCISLFVRFVRRSAHILVCLFFADWHKLNLLIQ